MKILLIFTAFVLIYSSVFSMEKNQKAVDPQHRVKIGDTAPNFSFEFTDGRKSKLSSYNGKVVMLQFTASWCSVCRQEMPHIENEIFRKLQSDTNFVLLGIDLKEDRETIQKFRSSTGVTYPIVLDTDGTIFELYAEKNSGVTRNIVIDQNGKIVFLTRLFDKLEFEKMKKCILELLGTK